MSQKQYGYEMEPRGQRSGEHSGAGGDPYGRSPGGDHYGRNYGMGPGADYGGGQRGDSYEMDPKGSQYGTDAPQQHDLGDGEGVVTRQPGPMALYRSPDMFDLPPGLAYLTQVDQLLVQQKMELCEIFTGCETKNRYKVKNTMGQEVYSAKEDTNWCNRQCCGPLRPFDMQIFDSSEREVLHLSRPLRCQGCCCPCCLQQMEIRSGDGQVLGTIRERWTWIKPKLTVHRPDGEHVFTIKGPLCEISCCGKDVNFRILTADGEQEIGMIRKQWSGLMREFFTDTDHFGVTFPMDLDVTLKAVLFGAIFLVDFMYFERSN